MKIKTHLEYSNKYVYRCSKNTCRAKKPIFECKRINTPKIPKYNYILSICEILCRDYEKRILNDCHISKMSLQKIKENWNRFFAEKNEIYKNIMLGGEYAVQIDEYLIYKRKLTLSPSNMYDELPGCTWLVGIIEEITGNMIIKIVEYRKIPTMTNIISSHV
ncbi:hypothetical protein DMUE_2516 [Dictyocoela muelleri]|nr:hypothetical protein DMUE_2516 [Dictyocoela muelleri]